MGEKLLFILFSCLSKIDPRLYPVRKPKYSCLSADRYAGDDGNRNDQLLIDGGVKALPFLTGFIPL